jgi:hypothetical protein
VCVVEAPDPDVPSPKVQLNVGVTPPQVAGVTDAENETDSLRQPLDDTLGDRVQEQPAITVTLLVAEHCDPLLSDQVRVHVYVVSEVGDPTVTVCPEGTDAETPDIATVPVLVAGVAPGQDHTQVAVVIPAQPTAPLVCIVPPSVTNPPALTELELTEAVQDAIVHTPVIVIVTVFEHDDNPPARVAVTITAYEPAAANTCDAVWPVAVVPSPKFHT